MPVYTSEGLHIGHHNDDIRINGTCVDNRDTGDIIYVYLKYKTKGGTKGHFKNMRRKFVFSKLP